MDGLVIKCEYINMAGLLPGYVRFCIIDGSFIEFGPCERVESD
jgi:hypothetical protein